MMILLLGLAAVWTIFVSAGVGLYADSYLIAALLSALVIPGIESFNPNHQLKSSERGDAWLTLGLCALAILLGTALGAVGHNFVLAALTPFTVLVSQLCWLVVSRQRVTKEEP